MQRTSDIDLSETFAPKTVHFMSREWRLIGEKYALANILEDITHIPVKVLQFDTDFSDVSVAMRMSWASMRKTSRIEDEAYCLFGIFGVNMPTLYGEGRNAFYRLQQEILRTSTDISLFLWGHNSFVSSSYDVKGHCEASLKLLQKVKEEELYARGMSPNSHPDRYLFSQSPATFSSSHKIISSGPHHTETLSAKSNTQVR